jgi:hypothetical protein
MSDITLNLKLEEVNAVLQALGQLPYAQISPLVEKVREQAVPQVQKIQEAEAAAPAVAPAA